MLSVIGIILIVIGAVIGAVFAQYPIAEVISFSVIMFGAGIECSKMWVNKKPGVKTWVTILCLVLTGGGSFILGLANKISEEQVTMIITYVVAIAMIIAGLLTPIITNKINEKKKLK